MFGTGSRKKMDFPRQSYISMSVIRRSFVRGRSRVCNADSLLNPFFGGRFGSLRLQKGRYDRVSFVGTEADEFACGKCRLRWLAAAGCGGCRSGPLRGESVAGKGGLRRFGFRRMAFPPCWGRIRPFGCVRNPFNRLYFFRNGRHGLSALCRREVYFCGKMPARFGAGRRSVPEAGRIRFLAGQPVLADLFGAAATFCREVAVFDPTFAVGRRIAGRKLPLRAVSVFSDKLTLFVSLPCGGRSSD